MVDGSYFLKPKNLAMSTEAKRLDEFYKQAVATCEDGQLNEQR